MSPAPHLGNLVREMRRIRDGAGLTYARLARRGAYSRASWTRFLTGRCLPPREAVLELARLGAADASSLLVLWELARWEDAHRPRARAERPSAGEQEAEPVIPSVPAVQRYEVRVADRKRSPRIAGAAVAAAALTASLFALTVFPSQPSQPSHRPDRSRLPAPSAAEPACRLHSCTGMNPQDSGCLGDGGIVGSAWVQGRRMDLFYSARCRAAWALVGREADGAVVRITDFAGGIVEGTVRGRPWLSPMSGSAAQAGLRACLTLSAGETACADAVRASLP